MSKLLLGLCVLIESALPSVHCEKIFTKNAIHFGQTLFTVYSMLMVFRASVLATC